MGSAKSSSKMVTGSKGNTRMVTGTEREQNSSKTVTGSKEATMMERPMDLELSISRMGTGSRVNIVMERLRRGNNFMQTEILKNVGTRMDKLTDSGKKYSPMGTGSKASIKTEIGTEKVLSTSRTGTDSKENTWTEWQKERGRCTIQMEHQRHKFMAD